MENTGEILCQISSLKDMLDQVNEEIKANIQITREIESEIVKCSETESTLALKESASTKSLYALHFEINGLIVTAVKSRKSVELLEKELCCLRTKREQIAKRTDDNCEKFMKLCLEFQGSINNRENNELEALLSKIEFLENELYLLDKKHSALENSVLAFIEEILEDIHGSSDALLVEIERLKLENEKLLRDIDTLENTLHSSLMANYDQW